MARKKTANTRRGIGRIGGAIVDDLNTLGESAGNPGLGTRLVREINQHLAVLNTRIEAQAGHHGTVTIAKQPKASSSHSAGPALDLQGGRGIGFSSQPTQDSEPITLEYWRKHEKDCFWFEKMFDECLDVMLDRRPCQPCVPVDCPSIIEMVGNDSGAAGGSDEERFTYTTRNSVPPPPNTLMVAFCITRLDGFGSPAVSSPGWTFQGKLSDFTWLTKVADGTETNWTFTIPFVPLGDRDNPPTLWVTTIQMAQVDLISRVPTGGPTPIIQHLNFEAFVFPDGIHVPPLTVDANGPYAYIQLFVGTTTAIASTSGIAPDPDPTPGILEWGGGSGGGFFGVGNTSIETSYCAVPCPEVGENTFHFAIATSEEHRGAATHGVALLLTFAPGKA